MSVLIRGMNMPIGCISCDFCNPFADEPYCRRLMRKTPKVTRLKDCPLVEVPTPHGRLIDGIDLLKAITENAYIIHHGHNEVEYGMSCFGIMQAISEAPTIIEAEEGEDHDA